MRKKQKDDGLLSQVFGGIINIVLGTVKLYIGIRTNCISILSDGYNNFGDFGGNVCGGIGISLSKKEPTEKYPHGYGRAEDIATFVMLTLFGLVGISFVYSSVERLFFHPPIMFAWWSFAVIGVTALIKIGMFFMYGAAYKKERSPVLRANCLDSLLDTAITLITLVTYVVSAKNTFPADAIFGIFIGTVLLLSILKAYVRSIKKLMGDGNEIILIREALGSDADDVKIIDAHAYGRRIEGTVCISDKVDKERLKALEENNIHLMVITEDKYDDE